MFSFSAILSNFVEGTEEIDYDQLDRYSELMEFIERDPKEFTDSFFNFLREEFTVNLDVSYLVLHIFHLYMQNNIRSDKILPHKIIDYSFNLLNFIVSSEQYFTEMCEAEQTEIFQGNIEQIPLNEYKHLKFIDILAKCYSFLIVNGYIYRDIFESFFLPLIQSFPEQTYYSKMIMLKIIGNIFIYTSQNASQAKYSTTLISFASTNFSQLLKYALNILNDFNESEDEEILSQRVPPMIDNEDENTIMLFVQIQLLKIKQIKNEILNYITNIFQVDYILANIKLSLFDCISPIIFDSISAFENWDNGIKCLKILSMCIRSPLTRSKIEEKQILFNSLNSFVALSSDIDEQNIKYFEELLICAATYFEITKIGNNELNKEDLIINLRNLSNIFIQNSMYNFWIDIMNIWKYFKADPFTIDLVKNMINFMEKIHLKPENLNQKSVKPEEIRKIFLNTEEYEEILIFLEGKEHNESQEEEESNEGYQLPDFSPFITSFCSLSKGYDETIIHFLKTFITDAANYYMKLIELAPNYISSSDTNTEQRILTFFIKLCAYFLINQKKKDHSSDDDLFVSICQIYQSIKEKLPLLIEKEQTIVIESLILVLNKIRDSEFLHSFLINAPTKQQVSKKYNLYEKPEPIKMENDLFDISTNSTENKRALDDLLKKLNESQENPNGTKDKNESQGKGNTQDSKEEKKEEKEDEQKDSSITQIITEPKTTKQEPDQKEVKKPNLFGKPFVFSGSLFASTSIRSKELKNLTTTNAINKVTATIESKSQVLPTPQKSDDKEKEEDQPIETPIKPKGLGLDKSKNLSQQKASKTFDQISDIRKYEQFQELYFEFCFQLLESGDMDSYAKTAISNLSTIDTDKCKFFERIAMNWFVIEEENSDPKDGYFTYFHLEEPSLYEENVALITKILSFITKSGRKLDDILAFIDEIILKSIHDNEWISSFVYFNSLFSFSKQEKFRKKYASQLIYWFFSERFSYIIELQNDVNSEFLLPLYSSIMENILFALPNDANQQLIYQFYENCLHYLSDLFQYIESGSEEQIDIGSILTVMNFFVSMVDAKGIDFRIFEQFKNPSFSKTWKQFINIFRTVFFNSPNIFDNMQKNGSEESFWKFTKIIINNHIDYLLTISQQIYKDLLDLFVSMIESQNHSFTHEQLTNALQSLTSLLKIKNTDRSLIEKISSILWKEALFKDRFTVVELSDFLSYSFNKDKINKNSQNYKTILGKYTRFITIGKKRVYSAIIEKLDQKYKSKTYETIFQELNQLRMFMKNNLITPK